MPPHRLRPITNPVTVHVDGHGVLAQEGEPLAVALTAESRLVLSRSLKYHRARGAFCYTGQCDGCLMRVNGIGNTMACETPCRDQLVVETQNVVGSATMDLLGMTDWMFPNGLDHHHLMTSPESINQWMQRIARNIAGVGKLPYAMPDSSTSVETLTPDVLVIGAGSSGLCAMEECSALGLRVIGIDEKTRVPPHAKKTQNAGARIFEQHSAVGVYERSVLVMRKTGLVVIRPQRLIIATGMRDALEPFPGSDVPGVINLQGALVLLEHGVVPGEKVALAGDSELAQELHYKLEETKASKVQRLPRGALKKVIGRTRVRGVEVQEHHEATSRRITCDALIVEGNPSAVYEVASQAGADIMWRNHRFEVNASEQDGRTSSPWTFAIGSCTGVMNKDEQQTQAQGAARLIREVVST